MYRSALLCWIGCLAVLNLIAGCAEKAPAPSQVAPHEAPAPMVAPSAPSATHHPESLVINPKQKIMAQGADEPTSAARDPASTPTDVPKASTSAQPTENSIVQVFYATDRLGVHRQPLTIGHYLRQFVLAGFIALMGVAWWLFQRVRGQALRRATALALLSAQLTTFLLAILGCFRLTDDARRAGCDYGIERGELELGVCEVSIPRQHLPGLLEAPSITRFELREDPDLHIILLSAQPLPTSNFYQQLDDHVRRGTSHELFVFVHGFNVTFADATRRAAQIAHDLPYNGTPVVFSWPSQGRGDPLAYTTDENTADWAVHHLEAFLAQLLQHHRPERLNLVAHSMGNRVLTEALSNLALRKQINGPFRELVFAAPDIDAGKFRDVVGPAMAPLAKQVTLYASANDEALRLSKQAHGYPRAGDTGDSLVVVSGIDTIDVSQVDTTLLGHSYYGDNISVLEDLFHLLSVSLPAEQRQWLERTMRNGQNFWTLRRQELEAAARARRGD